MPSQQDHGISPCIPLELDDLEHIIEVCSPCCLGQESVEKGMQCSQPPSEAMFDPRIRINTEIHEDGSGSMAVLNDRIFITGFERFTQRTERCHGSLQQHQPVPGR